LLSDAEIVPVSEPAGPRKDSFRSCANYFFSSTK